MECGTAFYPFHGKIFQGSHGALFLGDIFVLNSHSLDIFQLASKSVLTILGLDVLFLVLAEVFQGQASVVFLSFQANALSALNGLEHQLDAQGHNCCHLLLDNGSDRTKETVSTFPHFWVVVGFNQLHSNVKTLLSKLSAKVLLANSPSEHAESGHGLS